MREIECGFASLTQGSGVDLLIRYGPTVAVQVGFDREYRSGSGDIPNLHEAQHLALVDTGATLSCIDSTLAATLRLSIVDRESVSGVHGSQEVNVHLAQIYVPSLDWVIFGRFHGVHLVRGNQPHLALLGRIFLRDFTMTYDGRTGSVRISKIE
ncbi:MAG: hypothetical protein OXD35_08855 [Thiotrichales bacterium]|nr:hypothetical protein [Thiotrichales bacterium]